MGFTIREMTMLRLLPGYILVTAVIIFVLFWLGPFSTKNDLIPVHRALYWSIAVLGNLLVAVSLIPACIILAVKRGYYPVAGISIGSIVAAIPGTANIFLLEYIFRDLLLTGNLINLYFDVVIVTFAISMIFWMYYHYRLATRTPLPGKDDHAFVTELTGGSRLLHLEIQDHYLQVHTDTGPRTVLMRLGDAIDRIDPGRGLQVHRSHWVAHDAVARIERRAKGVLLVLDDNSTVPVSRSHLKKVRQAPWFR